jgi:penicillin-binding protein 1B
LRPGNFDGRYHGVVTARETIEQSLNIPAVHLAIDTGLERIAATFERFGLAHAAPQPAIALGAVDVTPVELAAVYATFASGGVRPVPHAIERVLDASRSPLEGISIPRPAPALDLQIAYLVDSTLRGALLRGTAAGVRRAGLEDRALAGKTGTSDEQRDSWFAGYARERVAVVWVGFDDNSPTRLPGSRGALPVWARFMASARPADGYHGLSLPEGIVTAKIDPETGHLATPACPAAREELFAAARAPVAFCPFRHDGTDGVELALAAYPEADDSPHAEAAYADATTSPGEALIELDGAGGTRGESWIVIRRVPRSAPPAPLPMPRREPELDAGGGAGTPR